MSTDREIDRQIAELMGYTVHVSDVYGLYYFDPKYNDTIPVLHYSSDWNAMRLLVEWLQGKGYVVELFIPHASSQPRASLYSHGELNAFQNADTTPLALCQAVLSLPKEVLG